MTENNPNIDVDIAIAGGGPTGLAMACALAGTGLRILLVDAGKEVITFTELAEQVALPTFDPRVSALTVTSQALLDDLGVWESIRAARVCPYHEMHVWDGEGTGSIHFSAAEIHADSLGYIVENNLVSAALLQQARLSENLTLVQEDKVASVERALSEQPAEGAGGQNRKESDLISLTLESGTVVSARLLIGADGGNSFVREQAGFSIREWDYGHQAIVTTVKTEKAHDYTAWQRFTRSGPLAFLPLHLPGQAPADQCFSSIVWSCVTQEAEGLLALEDEAFRRQLSEAFEYRLGNVVESDRRYSFPLWQRHATDYVQDQIALIGDAAHTIHPLAGQGVNLGFADVRVLSDVITAAMAKGEDFASHQVLSRYQRRRKGPNLGMMAAMEGFRHLFGSDNLALKWLRNNGLKMTDKLPVVKQQLIRQAMGL